MNQLSSLRLLIADAHEDTRLLLETLFQSEGASVQSAASGTDAIQQFDLHPPDVVLCEIALPGVDGYALLHHIRLHDTLAQRQTPVIAVTAWNDYTSSARTGALDFNAWVMKPTDPDALVAEVLRFTPVNRSWCTCRFARVQRLHRKLQCLTPFQRAARMRFPKLLPMPLQQEFNPAL
jgi:CheY-like chemotaxis protein